MAKTIITYLTSGDPNGIKTVELSNWIGKALVIPRALLKDAKKRPEIENAALYFLFGKDEDGNYLAYVGEAENFLNRIANHDTNKDFWDTAVAFVSKDKNLTKADVKFLEAKAVELAKASNLYKLQNSTDPNANNLPEYQVSAMEEFLENVSLLISAIGYPILRKTENTNSERETTYFCKGPSASGIGVYSSLGFVVRKGSLARASKTESAGSGLEKMYRELVEKKVLVRKDDLSFEFMQDYPFQSPSAASGIILFRRSNGWTEWKTKDGKTLDEVERKSVKG